jgi:putative DNA methylase
MSVAMPKLAAKSPIDLDVLMVCRKTAADRRAPVAVEAALAAAEERAGGKVRRFNATGRRLSLNDARIVAYSQVLVELCAGRASAQVLAAFEASLDTCAAIAQRLHAGQDAGRRAAPAAVATPAVQPSLF